MFLNVFKVLSRFSSVLKCFQVFSSGFSSSFSIVFKVFQGFSRISRVFKVFQRLKVTDTGAGKFPLVSMRGHAQPREQGPPSALGDFFFLSSFFLPPLLKSRKRSGSNLGRPLFLALFWVCSRWARGVTFCVWGGSLSVDCRFGWKILVDCIFFWPIYTDAMMYETWEWHFNISFMLNCLVRYFSGQFSFLDGCWAIFQTI